MSEGRITAADRAQARYSGLTVAECAARIGRSPSHVRNLIRSGALKARDLSLPGSKRADYAIEEAWLAEYMDSRIVQADAA